MAGRNSKFTQELADKIASAVSAGVPKKYAAESNGVSESTLYDWLKGGHGITKQEASEFSKSIMRAESQSVVVRIARIAKAAQAGDWKADTWHLEHVHADVFAKREVNEHTGKDGAPLEIVFRKVAKP